MQTTRKTCHDNMLSVFAVMQTLHKQSSCLEYERAAAVAMKDYRLARRLQTFSDECMALQRTLQQTQEFLAELSTRAPMTGEHDEALGELQVMVINALNGGPIHG